MADEPDEPKAWDADHPLLKSPGAPHEIAGVLRMVSAGWPAPVVLKTVGTNGSKLMQSLMKARTEEAQARNQGRAIHAETIPKGTE